MPFVCAEPRRSPVSFCYGNPDYSGVFGTSFQRDEGHYILLSFGEHSQIHSAQTMRDQSADPPASPRVAALRNQLQKGNRSAVTEFWEDVRKAGTPLLEPIAGDRKQVLVTFLWREVGDTRNVVVFLQTGGLNPADNQMTRLSDSDVWYRSYVFRKDVRFLYTLSPNDDLTPLNLPNLDWRKRFAKSRPIRSTRSVIQRLRAQTSEMFSRLQSYLKRHRNLGWGE